MSGTRRTEEFNTIKTQQIILQNPDVRPGNIIFVADSRGTLASSHDATFGTITADTLNLTNAPTFLTGTFVDISADTITARTLNLQESNVTLYDLSANRVDTTYLSATQIDADCINVATIFPTQIGSAAVPAAVLHVVQVNATNILATNITASNITGDTINADIVNSNINAPQIIVGDISATTLYATDATIDLLQITTLDVSAATFNTLQTTGMANIPYLTSIDISSSTINTGSATVDTLDVNSINILGTLTVAEKIKTDEFEATSIRAVEGTFGILNVDIANIDISGYYFPNLSAGNFTATTAKIKTLDVSGATTLANTTTKSLTVNGALTVNGDTNMAGNLILNVDGASIFTDYLQADIAVIAPVMQVSNQIQLAAGGNYQPISDTGVLTYDVSNGLLVNNTPVSNALPLSAVPFSTVPKVNNLATVADISASLSILIDSYNSFLNILNSKHIIITLTPLITFNSTTSIQFIIKGVARPPIILSGSYALDYKQPSTQPPSLISILNSVCSPNIVFSTYTQNNVWSVQMQMVDISNNSYIADVSGMPTGSLQVLRYLGIPAPFPVSSYERYDLSGARYILTPIPLVAADVSGASFGLTVNSPNVLPQPIYDVSYDPYSLRLNFTNVGSANLLAVQFNGVYTLYPNTTPTLTFGGLVPNTAYPTVINYLDASNNTVSRSTLTTRKIPYPFDISVNTLTYNSFTLGWTQPYPGKIYEFRVDISGDNAAGQDISGTSITFSNLDICANYVVNITSKDGIYRSDPSPSITITTPPLQIAAPSIRDISNSNVSKRVSWLAVPPGFSSRLDYTVNGGSLTPYSIPSGVLTYDISGLFGVGDISCSQVYTSGMDTIYSPSTIFRYDTSFGFFDLLANAVSPLILNGTTTGIGYIVRSTSPWSNYTIRRINFNQGISEISGNSVSIVANVYTVSGPVISGLYGPPAYTYSPFTPGLVDASSQVVSVSANATVYPTFNFSPPVQFTPNTIVLLQRTSGTGRIQFATFDRTLEPNSSNPKNNYASCITYSSNILSNSSDAPGKGIICQWT